MGDAFSNPRRSIPFRTSAEIPNSENNFVLMSANLPARIAEYSTNARAAQICFLGLLWRRARPGCWQGSGNGPRRHGGKLRLLRCASGSDLRHSCEEERWYRIANGARSFRFHPAMIEHSELDARVCGGQPVIK